MKSNLLLINLLFFSLFGFSQTIEVSGKVVDDKTGATLPGVNIVIKNSTQSISTDAEGNFKISNLVAPATLVFSYIGYKNYEIVAKKSQKLSVSLSANVNTLEEVVVVGYSSKKKKDVTGAVAILSARTIEELKPIKLEQALQGTVSGVNVTASSGAPGAGLAITIRGISTNANNGPLVLIDGYEGQLELLNPSDVESLSILKDAQAAVYGSRGANGVILVTTKQGKRNSKTKIVFNSYTGTQETTKKIAVLDATEYALLLNESYANAGLTLPYPNVTGLGKGTNWQNEVFSKAPIRSSDISISAGSDKTAYVFSVSNIVQDGIVGLDKSGFDRTTARISLNSDLLDKLKFQTNFNYTDFNRKSLNEGNVGSVLFNSINIPAILTPFDANAEFTQVPSTPGYGIEIINPLAQIANTHNTYNQQKLSGTTRLDYAAFKGFNITSRFGFNQVWSKSRSFSKEVSYGLDKVFNNTRSFVSQNAISNIDFTFDLFAEYSIKVADAHKFKMVVGTTAAQKRGNGLYLTGFDVPYNSWDYADINLAIGTSTIGNRDVGAYTTIYRTKSVFGTFDYDYKGRYLLSGIYRIDGSTAFGPGNTIAKFPSVLAGWIVSDEPFFKENTYLNFLKFRASYGELGNDNSDDSFKYRSILSGEATYVFNNELVNGVATGAIPNRNIRWEADKKLDFGFDALLFNKKIDITADYFVDTRKDLLIRDTPVSGINGGNAPGAAFPTVNAGTVSNKGIEFAIVYKDNLSKDFNFNLGFNMTTIKNEVLEVDNGTGFVEDGSFDVGKSLRPTRMVVGQPIGVFYGYQTEGVFQNQAEVNAHPTQIALGSVASPGDLRYKDVNGDGVIDVDDRTYIGKSTADYTLGFHIKLDYKNIDLVAYSYASIGNNMIRNYERKEAKLNKLGYSLDRWTGEGSTNSAPRVTAGASTNTVFSDFFVEDASFLRIQNLQLGYSFDKSLIEKIGASKIRLYASVNNLYTFTKYRGFDPAANSGNPISGAIDNGFYPTPKTYLFGINLIF